MYKILQTVLVFVGLELNFGSFNYCRLSLRHQLFRHHLSSCCWEGLKQAWCNRSKGVKWWKQFRFNCCYFCDYSANFVEIKNRHNNEVEMISIEQLKCETKVCNQAIIDRGWAEIRTQALSQRSLWLVARSAQLLGFCTGPAQIKIVQSGKKLIVLICWRQTGNNLTFW